MPAGTNRETSAAVVHYSVEGASSDVYTADTAGHHNKIFTLEGSGPLLGLFWYEARGQLVSIAKTGELCIHGEEEQGKGWQRIVKMKIGGGAAGGGPALMVAWIGGHILASANGRDDVVHMYDLNTEDNYILRLGEHAVASKIPSKTSNHFAVASQYLFILLAADTYILRVAGSAQRCTHVQNTTQACQPRQCMLL